MQKKIVIITLYQYGAFGSRVLSDVLKSTNHSVFNIFFKKDKTNFMELPTEEEKNNYFRKYPQLTDWIAFLPKLTFGLGLVFQCEFKRLWHSTRNFLRNTK